ncbi:MAG: hypothetical protein DMF50_02155 [Acidobacteria bacterium]|nr:MAG: hypothetical protein DMF50_02155 [Acidobacteriota bacterium]
MPLLDMVKNLDALFEGASLEPRRPPRFPGVAIDIDPGRITGVRVEPDRKDGALRLCAVESRSLPEGAIEPSLVRPNVRVLEPVALALRAILPKVATGEPRVSLLLPDHVARVALLAFATFPRTRRELVALVRFRMAKSLPFKPDEAVLDLMLPGGAPAPGTAAAGGNVLAVFMHRAVVEQYEALLSASGYWPGLVGLSTFELYNLFRGRLEPQPGDAKDTLFLNVTGQYLSLLLFRGEELIFYRCKPHAAEAGEGGGPAGIRREIYTSLAFYQEKLLGRGIGRAYLRVCGLPRDEVLAAAAVEVGCPIEPLDLLQVLPVAAPLALDAENASLAAPAAGAIVGRRS